MGNTTVEKINVLIEGKDNSKTAFESAGKNADGLGGKIGTLAKGIGVGLTAALATATAAVSAFAVDSFKSFIEAEKEMANANKILENTLNGLSEQQFAQLGEQVGNTEDAFAGLQTMMDEVGKSAVQLGFDDEEVSVAFAKLYQVSGDVEQAQSDVALAMDLAAFSGRGLEESAMAITRVHAGGTKILKEFGIEVKDGITTQEALAEVYNRVAGSADQMASTTAGQLQVLSISWTNLKETVGAALAEAITPFILELVAWFNDDKTQELISGIATQFGEFAKQLAPIIKQLLPAFIELLKITMNVIVFLGNAFIATSNFLGELIFQVMQAYDWFVKLIEKISEAIAKIREWVSAQANTVVSSWKNVGTNLKETFGFQSGGMVNAPLGTPVPAIVHGGETIIPSGRTNSGMGGGIVVNILGGTYLSEDVALEIGNMIGDRLKLQLRV
jgi:phage-related protein